MADSLSGKNRECYDTLISMGFTAEQSLRGALYSTNVERAMEHAMKPPVAAASAAVVRKPAPFVVNREHLGTLQSMGFAAVQSAIALRMTNNNADRAMNLLIEHPERLDKPTPEDWAPFPDSPEAKAAAAKSAAAAAAKPNPDAAPSKNDSSVASSAAAATPAAAAASATPAAATPIAGSVAVDAKNDSKSATVVAAAAAVPSASAALQPIASASGAAAAKPVAGSSATVAKPDSKTASKPDVKSAAAGKKDSDYAVSAAEVNKQLLVHKAVWLRDTGSLAEYCKRGLQNGLDYKQNTPLALAHRLGYDDVVNFLLDRGADPRIPTGRGWTVLQEACILKQKQVATDVHLHTILLKQHDWETKIPEFKKALEKMPDFYMEIQWKVESWVPFVAQMAPSDVFKIWKKGDKLRFDSNMRMDGSKGKMSFLFSRGSLYLVDHTQRYASDALAQFRRPDYDRIQAQVSAMISSDMGRSDLKTKDVTFTPQKSFWGGKSTEKINDLYNCNIIDMKGLEFAMVQLKKTAGGANATAAQPVMPEFDAYFAVPDAKAEADAAALAAKEKAERKAKREKQRIEWDRVMKEKGVDTKNMENPFADAPNDLAKFGIEQESDDNLTVIRKPINASLWMSDEFPLPMESLMHILEIIAPASSDITKLKDILAVKLPPGFPVKLLIPVMPAVSAAVTFSKFEKMSADDELFELPPDFETRELL